MNDKPEMKIGFMGIGDVGCGVVWKFALTQTINQKYILVNSKEIMSYMDVLSVKHPELKNFEHLSGCGYSSIVVDLNNMRSCESSVQKSVEGLDAVIIVAALGGRTARALAPLIASIIKGSGVWVSFLLIIPFSSEGKIADSLECVSELYSQAHNVLLLSNDSMIEQSAKDTTVAAGFAQMDIRLIRGIEMLMQLVKESPKQVG